MKLPLVDGKRQRRKIAFGYTSCDGDREPRMRGKGGLSKPIRVLDSSTFRSRHVPTNPVSVEINHLMLREWVANYRTYFGFCSPMDRVRIKTTIWICSPHSFPMQFHWIAPTDDSSLYCHLLLREWIMSAGRRANSCISVPVPGRHCCRGLIIIDPDGR